jgi:hypothetical protein
MENRKIIRIIFFVILFGLLFYIFKNFNFDYCVNYFKGYRKIKNELYKKGDSLYILKKHVWYEDNDEIEFLKLENKVALNNKLICLNEILDIETFCSVNNYYYDKKYIYFFNSKPFLSPTLNAISSKSKKLKSFCCDYVSTDNKIFFQSTEIINVDINTFKVTDETRDGCYFAKDKNHYYYKDSIVSEEYFNEVKNAIRE